MALDPRISLATQVADVGGAIRSGLQNAAQIQQNKEQRQTADVRKQILEQEAQQGQFTQAQQKGQYLNQLATGLMNKPLDQRAAVVAQQLPFLTQLGMNPAEILGQDLTNQGLQSVISQTQPFMQQSQNRPTAAMQEFEYFNSILANPNATPDQKQAAAIQLGTEASAGRGQLRETAVKGVFQVFDPNTNAFSDPFRQDGQPLTRQQQLELGLQERAQETQTIGQAETGVQVERAQQLKEVELQAASEQSRRDRSSKFIGGLAASNQEAARTQVQLAEAMKLAQNADQGLAGGAKLFLSRLPGMENIDVGDTAALDSALKSIAIQQLQSFKGPTTDFEFGVVQDISGDILGSAKANQARLAALQRAAWFRRAEFEQAKRFTEGGGDPVNFAFNFEEQLKTGKGEFSLRQLQDTAVANNMSIEEVLERLK